MERFLGFVKQIRRSRRRKGKKYRPEEDYHEGYEDVYYYASEHLHIIYNIIYDYILHKHCPCGKYSSIRVATYLRSKILFPKVYCNKETAAVDRSEDELLVVFVLRFESESISCRMNRRSVQSD
ncbi:hypothetical protein QTP86_026138 [Hemibagrus guttatus]|nr:hypothetical protein QTP86_026138 [Hemibagrus guttatus]